MPEYLTPGVYIEEFEIGAKPIEGVSTSTAGFLGVAEKGSTEGLPELVTSFSDFQRKFGSYLGASYGQYRFLPYAVDNFFVNGGSRCYVMRVAPSEKKAAALNENVPTGVVLQLTKDVKSGDSDLYLESLRGIDIDSKITLKQILADSTVDVLIENLEIDSYDRSENKVTLKKALNNDCLKKSTIVTVTTPSTPSTTSIETLKIFATSIGKWGEKILVKSIPAFQAKTQITDVIDDATNSLKYKIKNKNGFYQGAIVVYDNGEKKQYRRVTALEDDIVTLSKHLDGDNNVVDNEADPKCTIATCEFTLRVVYKDQTETFSNLSMNPDTPNYFMNAVNDISKYITLKSPYESPDNFKRTDPFDMPTNSTMVEGELCITLSNGGDVDVSKLTAADFMGKDDGPGKRSGIKAFNDIDEVNIIAAPGITDINVQMALINHCEDLKDRFAVLDVPENCQEVSKVQGHRKIYDSHYSSMYHPWLKVFDPLEKRNIFMPPSGSVIGIYARSDQTRGVHKAPANEVVRGAIDLKYRLNNGEQGILNHDGVNVIRNFPGRGIRVWGARTTSSNTLWKYINVRRLFIYIEESIEEGTQWVVFEPNDEKLWARVRATITQFLTVVWRDGALMGTKAEEAFFVKCDRSTMTQDDIDNGKLICVIGVSPVKPAEFVIFRIAQWTGGSSVTE